MQDYSAAAVHVSWPKPLTEWWTVAVYVSRPKPLTEW